MTLSGRRMMSFLSIDDGMIVPIMESDYILVETDSRVQPQEHYVAVSDDTEHGLRGGRMLTPPLPDIELAKALVIGILEDIEIGRKVFRLSRWARTHKWPELKEDE